MDTSITVDNLYSFLDEERQPENTPIVGSMPASPKAQVKPISNCGNSSAAYTEKWLNSSMVRGSNGSFYQKSNTIAVPLPTHLETESAEPSPTQAFGPKIVGNGSEERRISKQDREGLDPESLLFRDGRRKVDMVLAWEEEDLGVMTEAEARRRDIRRCFMDNLVKEGLEVELEDKSQSFNEKTFFLKVHLPWRLETRLAEVMNLKFPIKRFITISVKPSWVSPHFSFRTKLQFIPKVRL